MRGAVFQAGTSGNHFDILSLAAPHAVILQQTDNTRNALGVYFRTFGPTFLLWNFATCGGCCDRV